MKQIIGYSVDREAGIFNSLGESQQEEHYLDFLLDKYDEDVIKVLASLDDDVANLLLLLKLESWELVKLYEKEKLYLAPYTIKYFPNKMFSISKGFGKTRPFCVLSDASQYNKELDKPANRHDKVYHQTRAMKAEFAGREAYKVFIKLGTEPSNLISPINAYKDKFKLLDLPELYDIPKEAQQLAYKCCHGSWLECFQRGHFDEVYDYDQVSAYPYQASKLLDLRLGEWKHTSDYVATANYGYCKGVANIKANFSPITYETDGSRNFTPTREFETCLTKGKIDTITARGLGNFKILDGWWWTAKGESYPMKEEIHKLFELKEQAIGMEKEIIKRIMSGGFYGKFLQVFRNEPAQSFCAPWAAEIENNTDLDVYNYIMDNGLEDSLVHIAVDGFVSTKPLIITHEGYMGEGMAASHFDRIGDWRLSNTSKAIVVSSGLVALEKRETYGDFSIGYEKLRRLIEQEPEARSYKVNTLSTVTLGEAIQQKRLEDLGKVESVNRTIDLYEQKRVYFESPKIGKDLLAKNYQSIPYPAEMLKKLL